jgi:hypothetical protein
MEALPTAEQYKTALTNQAKQMPAKHREMLLEHYRAPGHCITASELAKKVGYKNYSAVNIQYGTLGYNLGAAMKWTRPVEAQASYSIASFIRPDHENREWRWEMHEELAKALEELGWVSAPTAGAV